jgi:metallo-beta-lactamase family protein
MAVDVTDLFCKHRVDHRLDPVDCRASCHAATMVSSVEDSRALNERSGPMMILSASGMLTGGRILHHLKAFAPDPKNTILLVGYQAAGTRGAALLGGARSLRIHGGDVEVRAEVVAMNNLSAHADAGEILMWLRGFDGAPRRTFITHGEPTASAALKTRIEQELGWTCELPKFRQTVFAPGGTGVAVAS